MTVSSYSPDVSTGNGATTVFPYSFRVLAVADLEVSVDGVVKTYPTDYSVSGVGSGSGGNVTFVVAPANGAEIIRRRNMELVRTTDYQDNGDLLADVLNPDQDAPVMMAQQIQEQVDRSLKFPLGDSAEAALPSLAERAEKGLGFDADGNLVAFDVDAVGVAAAVAAAAASAATAATQAGVATGAATTATGAATTATTQAGLASTARTAAEAARDAALAAARIYATTAAGLAAVASGEYFYVPSANASESLILYLDNAGTAVEQKRYPSTNALNEVAAGAIAVINNITDTNRNLFDSSAITNLQALVRATGALTAAGAQFTTGYIPVVSGGQFVASAAMSGDATFGGYSFYDRSLVFISSGLAVAANTAVTVPSGAVWMRCSFATTVVQGALMIANRSTLPTNYQTHTYLEKQAIREMVITQVLENAGVVNLFDPARITDSFYLAGNNNTTFASALYYITNYIPVVQGGTITFNGTSPLSSPYGLSFYDINQNHISGATGNGTPPVSGTAYTVPFGAAYVRCTFDKAGNPASDLMAVHGGTLPTYYVPYGVSTASVKNDKYWADTGVMFLGDSITANFPGAKQWPKWLCGRLNATHVANNAAAGRVMADLVKTSAGVALGAGDFTSVGLVVCMAGTNDFNAAYGGGGVLIGASTDAAAVGGTFCARVKYVIETLYGLKSTMRVVFMTPTFRSAASGLAATTLTPQSKNLYDYADAVIACCKVYGVPVLDLLREGGMNTFNSATYLSDGLHPDATDGGVTIIGKPAAAWLNSIR